MLIPILIATDSDVTGTAAQSAFKRVTCESCGCEFGYEMLRRYSKSENALLDVHSSDARKRAVEGARRIVHSALREHEDPVACPQCGWFQRSMVAKNSMRRWPWSPWGSGQIDPNVGFPQNRGHFPGAPTAVRMVPGTDTPAAQPTYLRAPDLEPGIILCLRVSTDRLQNCCCVCLKEAGILVSAGCYRVPICASCRNTYYRKPALWNAFYFALPPLLLLPIAAVIMTLVRVFLFHGDVGQFVGMCILALLMTAAVSAGAGFILWW